jgi:hypothetical protein
MKTLTSIRLLLRRSITCLELTTSSGFESCFPLKDLIPADSPRGSANVGTGTASEQAAVEMRSYSLTSPPSHNHLLGAATVEVEVLRPLIDVLKHPGFLPRAPGNQMNPLVQHYVFYQSPPGASTETGPTAVTATATGAAAAALHVEEYGIEARISAKMSIMFMESFLSALAKSRRAWMKRRDFEAVRGGRFVSLGDALRSGWCHVSVSVMGARIEENSNAIVSAGASAGVAAGRKPSTFVGIYVDSLASPFTEPIGSTNTEYCSLEPSYGTNVNAFASKKVSALSTQ